jgi:O-antigen/teichoic acid export membrane protein
MITRHGRALAEIAGVSALGILATTAFQIITIRGLGPSAYGLLAAALALINVAAIGSSALRNSVAVTTAEALHVPHSVPGERTRRMDGALIEALVLGGIGTLGVFALSSRLAAPGALGVVTIVLTAAAMIPNFLFALAQGRLQGAEDSRAVVWWSTGAQVAQAVLALAAILLGGGSIAILVILVLTALTGAIGAGSMARRRALAVGRSPFTMQSTVVLLLTVGFAWLTNADVVLVRGDAPDAVAGAYAAAAVLIKTTLIIPSTFSLYLLPRFVRSKGNAALTNLGVTVILAVTLLTGLVMFAAVSLLGPWIVGLLFGSHYAQTAQIVVAFSVAWLPWALAQGVLVRITAIASRTALAVFLLGAVAQWLVASATLPDVDAWLIGNGLIGLAIFLSLYGIHWALLIRSRRAGQERAIEEPATP